MRSQEGVTMTEMERRRRNLARRLFAEWHGLTNPELVGAMWNNLSPDDRAVWLQRAGERLEERGEG